MKISLISDQIKLNRQKYWEYVAWNKQGKPLKWERLVKEGNKCSTEQKSTYNNYRDTDIISIQNAHDQNRAVGKKPKKQIFTEKNIYHSYKTMSTPIYCRYFVRLNNF